MLDKVFMTIENWVANRSLDLFDIVGCTAEVLCLICLLGIMLNIPFFKKHIKTTFGVFLLSQVLILCLD